MDEKERGDVKSMIREVLDTGQNGFVRRGACDAITKLQQQSMDTIEIKIDDVRSAVGKQDRVLDDLGDVTHKLNVSLVEHTAEHTGMNKAESTQTRIESLKARKRRFWLGVIGLGLSIATALVLITLWIESRTVKKEDLAEAIGVAVEEIVDRDRRRRDSR